MASKPDEIKGDAPVLFVTLKEGEKTSDELKKEITKH